MDKEREAMIESMAKDLYVIDERAIADWVDKYQENYFNMARYLFDIGVRPIEGFEIKEKTTDPNRCETKSCIVPKEYK